MSNDIIEMNFENIDGISDKMGKINEDVKEELESSIKNFSALQNVNLYGDGITVINDQIKNVSKQFNDMQELLQKQNKEMYELEKGLVKVAEQIRIPNNFDVNDVEFNSTFSSISLDKNDGRSVNEGTFVNNINTQVEYDFNKKDLQNINNNNITEEQKYDDSSTIETKNIENIEKDNTQAVDVDFDDDKIERENIEDMQSSVTMEVPDSTNYDIEDVDLENINNE